MVRAAALRLRPATSGEAAAARDSSSIGSSSSSLKSGSVNVSEIFISPTLSIAAVAMIRQAVQREGTVITHATRARWSLWWGTVYRIF